MNIERMKEQVYDSADVVHVLLDMHIADMLERIEMNPNIYENWCVQDFTNHFFNRNVK